MHPEQVQAQGVETDRHGREAHRNRADDGLELKVPAKELLVQADCQRNADDVVEEGPEQVLPDVPDGGAAQTEGRRHVTQTALHQHHVRRVDRHVRAGSDGNAGVRPGQGRGVVDAVSHHRDLSDGLQPADDRLFSVGQNARNHPVDACGLSDRCGGAGVVAGQHHHPHTRAAELGNRLGAVLLHRVRYGDQAEQRLAGGKEEGCFSFLRQSVSSGRQRFRDPGGFGKKAPVPAAKDQTVPDGLQAVSGHGAERCDLCQCRAACFGTGDHSFCQRVLAPGFQGVGRLQQGIFCYALCRDQIGHGRLTLRQRAGLVQHGDLGFSGRFQGGCGLEEDAVSGALAAAHHNCHRSRQPQGAGTADDQHGHRPGQGEGEVLSGQQPPAEGQQGHADDGGHKHGGNPVGDPGNRRLGRRGVRNHADDLGEGRVLADAGRAAADETGLVQGGGRDGVSLCLVHRDALAGQGGFVDRGGALDDHAVHRHVLTRPHHKDVADLQLVHGDLRLLPVPQDVGGLRHQLHQTLQRVRGPALGIGLQRLADRDQRRDHRRGLEPDVLHGQTVHPGGVAPAHRVGHRKESCQAVEEGGG